MSQKAIQIIIDSKGKDWYKENVESVRAWNSLVKGIDNNYITIKLKSGLKMDFKNTSQNPYLKQIKQAFT